MVENIVTMGLFVLADLFKEIKPIHALDDTYIQDKLAASSLVSYINML